MSDDRHGHENERKSRKEYYDYHNAHDSEKSNRQINKDSRGYYEETSYNRGEYRNYKDNREQDYYDGKKNIEDGSKSYSSFRHNQNNPKRMNYYDKPKPYKSNNEEQRMSDLDYVSNKGNGYNEKNKRVKTEIRSNIHEKTKQRHVPADPNCTIGVFGFGHQTVEEDVNEMLKRKLNALKDYSFKLIMDERTNQCKGYCFITFSCLNDAISAKELLNTDGFRGNDFKCDFAYKQKF